MRKISQHVIICVEGIGSYHSNKEGYKNIRKELENERKNRKNYSNRIKQELESNPNKEIILCSCGYYDKEGKDNCPICGEKFKEEEENNNNYNKKLKYKIVNDDEPKKGFMSSIFNGLTKNPLADVFHALKE